MCEGKDVSEVEGMFKVYRLDSCLGLGNGCGNKFYTSYKAAYDVASSMARNGKGDFVIFKSYELVEVEKPAIRVVQL